MSNYEDRGERLAHRDPAKLDDGEWRVLISYRMDQVEKRVSSILTALWANLATIAIGIIIYLVTSNLGDNP